MSISPSDIAILIIKGSNYRSIISLINKNEAINLMQNPDLTEKMRNIIKHENLFSYVKMGKEILTFVNIEIEKNKFYRHITISLGDADIEKVLVSYKISFGEKNYKYLIGYLYNGN